MATSNKLKTVVSFGSGADNNADTQLLTTDYQPLVDMFALLIEWEAEEVKKTQKDSK